MPEKTVQKEPGKKPVPSKKPKPQQEVVVQISLSELHPFPDHPFQVREDASMQETAESVKEYGVLVPALARPREDGGYELIAGHRRKHACELAGLATMPVIVRDIDQDVATIIMVDSNLQRENILPSERAKAYKMKMEAIKRQGARTDLTSPKISAKFRSDDEVGQDAGVSGDTIRNYRRGVCCPLNGAVAAGGYGFAVVDKFSVNAGEGEYVTEYRVYKGSDWADSEISLDLEDLVAELAALCDPYYEHEQPIYEL